ncbi:unnamed protein product [Polarella glacialis]|uniref:Uncharacterized protein n=1 Tax=Polarella glacialis TaxID=89957 RepID=A0A813GYE1_POLGL|nr:unnamed protein product [Polarella glacialis]
MLMRTLLLKMVKDAFKVKKARPMGLPDEQGSDDESGLSRLAGARGTVTSERLKRSMKNNPAAFADVIEQLAANKLGAEVVGQDTLEHYVRDELPIGEQRTLGYCVWILLAVHKSLKQEDFDQARLHVDMGLAVIEQFLPDSNWISAWRMTQLSQPPFAAWSAGEGQLGTLQRELAYSRLVEPTWVAAIIARLRDEEILVNRRGAPGGGRKFLGKGDAKGTKKKEE